MKQFIVVLALLGMFVAPIAQADKPDGSVYLDGGDVKYGLILAHGRGKSPTWLVVDPLRKGIHDQLGYHTLSLQMPIVGGNWKNYAGSFPEAYRTIDQGISFLKEKGVTRIYLLGHSMGARMASAFVATHPNSGLAGLIVLGCWNNGEAPLDCAENLQKVSLPVLDISGGRNGKDSEAAAERAGLRSATYTQVAIDGANHKYENHEQALVAAVVSWLKKQK